MTAIPTYGLRSFFISPMQAESSSKFLSMAAVALLAALGAPAWAVNKCTGPDGKLTFQDAPCPGKGERIEVRPSAGLVFSRPVPAAETLAPHPPAAQVEWPKAPEKSALEQEADMCLAWYRPLLRDPATAYYTIVSKEKRVLSISIHATNGYGGYAVKEASCEIYNGRLNPEWTKIHAQRGGWAVE